MNTLCIKRFGFSTLGLAIAICVSGWATPCEGGSWMFRRSYHSHSLPQQAPRSAAVPTWQPQSESAYRPAIRGGSFGFGARGAIRWNRINLNGGGPSWDTTLYWEHFFQPRP